MWGTTVGPPGATGASDVGGPRMDKFLSDDSSEFNGQRCHNNREQTEFSSEEEDDKSGRFLYPVLDLHKGGTQTSQDDNSKLWPTSSHMSPPQAHSRTNFGGLVSPLSVGFADRSRHHLDLQQQQQHDRLTGRDALGIHNTRIDGGGSGEPSSTMKGSGSLGSTPHHSLKMTRTIKSYHCRMCEQEFENKSDMQRHAKEAHRMEEKGHKCSKCFKSFPSSQQLAQHSLVHTNVRKYPCRFCEKAFKQLSHVQQHQRIHTGERPYQCTVDGCSKAFRQLSSLQQHIKGHNIPLPKSYPITHSLTTLADMTPSSNVNFGHNDKINSSLARPHDLTCQVCEKHCVDEVRFFRHIHKYHPDYWRVFSGGRPLNDFIETRDVKPPRDKMYTCDICQKSYSNETGYWKHMVMHPGTEADRQVQLYKCLVCKKLFTKEAYLLRHMEMKLDEQHCQGLVELKKNSAMFRVTQAETYLLPPPMIGQIDNDPVSPGDMDSKAHLGDGESGMRFGHNSASGGGAGCIDGREKSVGQKLMPPRAHSSSAYPAIPLGRSLSLDHQVVPYSRIHSPEMFDERMSRMDRCEPLVASRNESPTALPPRLIVCDPRDTAAATHPNDSAAMSPRASLSGSSSPCSPMSVQSFSYHGDAQQQQQQQGIGSRPVTTDGRQCQPSHRTLYSPSVHVSPSYYSKSVGSGQEMLHARGFHGSGGGAGGGSAQQPYPQSPATSCLPRSPEEQQQRSPEDQKPFVSHDYMEPASPYVQRFQSLSTTPTGGRSSPHIMIPPGPFVHPSVMSPPYSGPSRQQQQQQQETLLRRGEISSELGMDAAAAAAAFQRHSSEIADRSADIYMRRSDPVDHHDPVGDIYQQRSDVTDAYLHRPDMLERDLNAYLRRNDISESDVDAFLRRNDLSECYIATALSQLARSIPGFR